jgi:hypothetical protein
MRMDPDDDQEGLSAGSGACGPSCALQPKMRSSYLGQIPLTPPPALP